MQKSEHDEPLPVAPSESHVTVVLNYARPRSLQQHFLILPDLSCDKESSLIMLLPHVTNNNSSGSGQRPQEHRKYQAQDGSRGAQGFADRQKEGKR